MEGTAAGEGGSHTKTTIRNHVAGIALTWRHHRGDTLALVAVPRRADCTAGPAVPGIALKGHARVATLVVLADTLAALALHKRRALQAAGATVVGVGLGVKGAVASAVAAYVIVNAPVATGAAIVRIVALKVDKALAVTIVIVRAAADADAPARILSIGGSDAGIIVIGFPEGRKTRGPRYDRSIERCRGLTRRSVDWMFQPRIITSTCARHAVIEVGIALLPVRTGAVVCNQVSASGKT